MGGVTRGKVSFWWYFLVYRFTVPSRTYPWGPPGHIARAAPYMRNLGRFTYGKNFRSSLSSIYGSPAPFPLRRPPLPLTTLTPHLKPALLRSRAEAERVKKANERSGAVSGVQKIKWSVSGAGAGGRRSGNGAVSWTSVNGAERWSGEFLPLCSHALLTTASKSRYRRLRLTPVSSVEWK